ncbi:hypothetical protein KIPB_016796, partial [Kipferlia bialata]
LDPKTQHLSAKIPKGSVTGLRTEGRADRARESARQTPISTEDRVLMEASFHPSVDKYSAALAEGHEGPGAKGVN